MQIDSRELLYEVLRLVLDPLLRFNPFFSLYYNPLSSPPSPEVPRNQYFNYVHQVALLLDVIPRRRVRVLIGDEVGLGKTVEAIRIVKYLLNVGEAEKVLIVAPRQLIKQWLHSELRDLLYSPGVTRLLSRRSFEDIKKMLNLGRQSRVVVLAPLDLVKRGSLDRHARGPYRPYYDLVSGVDWDLVVVDEAHHLGFTRARPPLRTRRLAPICGRAKHLVLLSATPSRGTHEDMLGRLSLLIPELTGVVERLRRDERTRREFYERVSDYLVYRRTKEHVNALEGKQVFTNLTQFLALIKLGETRELYENLGSFVARVLKSMDPETPAILKVVVLKRALSSPYSFLKTFKKVIEGVGARTGRVVLSGYPSDYLVERDSDNVVEEVLLRTLRLIPQELVGEALNLLGSFEKLYSEGDPGFKALAHLLHLVATNSSEVPRELIGDYIVFSEYRDTVDYLFSKLVEFFESRGFRRDEYAKRLVLENALKDYRERRYFERAGRRYEALLNQSIAILVKGDTWVFLGRISSQNQEIVYLVPDVVEAVNRYATGRVLKVLLSTDVASEGLNLQQFNVVVNYDVPWSPIRREQRVGRVYRLRQRRDCSVVDFVRETTPEYAFYTKLVLKLLNIAEQRLLSRPIEGLLELYVTRRGATGEEYLVVSERPIGEVLVGVYEKLYGEGRSVEDTLEEAYRELLGKVRAYRTLVQELTSRSYRVDAVKQYVEEFTGCSSHEEFSKTVPRALEVFFGRRVADPARALRELFEVLFSRRQATRLPAVLLVHDHDLEEGYVGVVDFVVDGRVRYSTPVALLKVGGSWRVLNGLKVLQWLVELYGSGRLKPVETWGGPTSLGSTSLPPEVKLFARRLNQYLSVRLKERERRLGTLLGTSLEEVADLEVVPRDGVVRVVGYHSLVEYSRFREGLPLSTRLRMDEAGINYVAKLYEERGCTIAEKNVGVMKPYDLLVYCPGSGGLRKYFVEVKSHLRYVLVAELSEAETELAESNPYDYVVCNVMGLGNPDSSTWLALCGLYAELPKVLVTETREERRARLFFQPQR
jgi:superfamily II DNA or RNA helicase